MKREAHEYDQQAVARMALACLDLTDLNDDSTEDAVRALCDRAMTAFGPTAAICIWPRFVAAARRHLGPLAPVRIATVVNFPSGDLPVDTVVGETVGAIADGADEIDMVIPWRAVKAGDMAKLADLVSVVRAATPRPALLKTILETGELDDPELVEKAAHIALASGADFIKSSTGKVKVNATLETAEIMLEVLRQHSASSGGHAGLKPAGGIRTVADAAAYFALCERIMGRGWVAPARFRIGASGLLTDILATLEGNTAARAEGDY
ncbi:deoxyribose-phosphate aldolase [Pseudohoeflea coraliihabitans]|uniref:Deoxyribose-phosphate aldolase n=1 Tax=Pseudohoeflea coraliihabitans TaxID=2860393 RepID=A0ABS6WQX0_9HYPH|nr:deoxyribose-phosphate aldolase [Pseudohoeflea sp. DP4N28-3]MBW3097797.1 deoxyribose-phosphate aldolase [Pseudohoeflea sp. DP4N28-3]